MSKKLALFLMTLLSVFHLRLASAEDIDLFAGATPASTSELPNVLIVLDNTANWNTAFTNEMSALVSVVSGLPVNKFRVGLMMFTESGGGSGVGGNTGNDGAYVRSAIRTLDADYKTKLVALLNSLHILDDKSNGGKGAKAMWEAHQYFAGAAPHAGNNKAKTDYTGSTWGTAQSQAIYAKGNNALPSKAGSPYTSPVVEDCAKNFIIYISNGAAQDNNSDLTAATNALSAVGGSTTTIPISPSGSQNNVADEWARYMKQSSLNVVTYTIDVNKVTTGQGPGWTALLKSMANVSTGKYFDVVSSGTQIVDALNDIFSEIQSVNSVFASVSLPVSVNTQGTYLNQVFVGMFRPAQNAYPRWNGNLKQYRLGFVNGSLGLLDANPTATSAINSQTGFITECARSYWTPSAVDTYWAFSPSGECLTIANSASSNYPDGNIVEKGGQAYMLRGGTSRTVYTCSPTFGSCTTLTSFATTNSAVTNTLLGVTTGERDNTINWSRGLDIADEDLDGTTSAEMRPSVHGDVVHSRPVAINFGTDASPQVVVFYGANDGMLRAINGNRTASIGSVTAGSEMWAFMPPEFYSKVSRLRTNTLQINFPNVSGTTAPKDYGIDGPITAYRNSAGTSTWLYATMRRGGRVIYAFDVSTPATPTLKWKIGCPNAANDTDCSSGFSQIGQTWSPAVPINASGYGSGSTPLLIMGGGYDTCEDSDTPACSSPKGNRIYVMDADTGALQQTLNTDRSVVGEISIVKDSSGLAKYAYAADTGGNIYRITIGSSAPSAWTITKVASVGCTTTAACTNNRKFMFSPDVVVESDTHILLIGSGDREKPLETYTNTASVSNYFFMIKDKPTEATWLTSEAGNCETNNVVCLASLLNVSGTSPAASAVDAKKGWYLSLSTKEQVVTSAITVFGTVTFSTHIPSASAQNTCASNLGTARAYNVSYTNAATKNGTSDRYQELPEGGLSPSPVAGKVTLDDGQQVVFVIGASPESSLQAKQPTGSTGFTKQPRKRVYWNINK